VTRWPAAAEQLGRRFWPGPLTLVLPKRKCIPDIVSAGLPTVALRVPANPIALALLTEAAVPIAAPSANRFTELSPTTAEHVRKSFAAEVDLILDGGPSQVGIESTVLSLAGFRPQILRAGMISRDQIENVIGEVTLAGTSPEGPHLSPGMHAKHYSPRTPLLLHLPSAGRGAYLFLTSQAEAGRKVQMPADPGHYAAILYATLHSLDEEGLDWIAVELPPDQPEWSGIRDRLKRAAAT
jgi:L-threonylcarbamoyladenylate synthase